MAIMKRNASNSWPDSEAFDVSINVLVGDYHYFRAHQDYLVGRVHIPSGKVEYLQVPVQVNRSPGENEVVSWDDAVENDMKNVDGFRVTRDRHARTAGDMCQQQAPLW